MMRWPFGTPKALRWVPKGQRITLAYLSGVNLFPTLWGSKVPPLLFHPIPPFSFRLLPFPSPPNFFHFLEVGGLLLRNGKSWEGKGRRRKENGGMGWMG